MREADRPPLTWTLTPKGTWVAIGWQWGYELIPNPNGKDIDGNPKELWNVRAWFHLSDKPRSRIIGGYGSVETAKWYVQRGEDNPRAAFKNNWFSRIFEKDSPDHWD